MKLDRFSYVTYENVSPLVPRAQNHAISRGISIHVRKRFKRVWATRVSKHVTEQRTRQIAWYRCHSLLSYVLCMAMNIQLDGRPDAEGREGKRQGSNAGVVDGTL